MLQLLQVYFQELSLLTATDRTDISSKRDRFVYAMAICLFVVPLYQNSFIIILMIIH